MAIQIDLTSKENVDVGVENTKKIIETLKAKASAYKLNFKQLKEAFVLGASCPTNEFSPNICGWARVNMMIRINDGGKINLKKTSFRQSINFIEVFFEPEECDFKQARKDVENLGIACEFKDISELYLDDDISLGLEKYL